ncbi:ATP synthase subunit I [Paenibacillus chungangensis]|uniref:ATP synthase subunit I n=1 Tax=Paenibacillus chungangensis TaxID=696535 RepID=A0ABW3HK16_9BACL
MDNILRSAMRLLFFLMLACLVLWAAVPDWKTVSMGLLAGLAASAMNAFLLRRRIALVTDAALSEKRKRRSLGFGNRIAMVLLLAMIAYRYPEVMSLPAALIGSMVMPFLILAAAIRHTIKENNGKG